MNVIWFAFLTGLTTGGLSCLAVQGGLLASAVAPRLGDAPAALSKKLPQIGMFIAAKLLSYTLLGLILGLIGSTLVLSPKVFGWVQIGAGLFMVVTALRLIDAHPMFRYFVVTPPRWAFRLLKTTSRSESLFAPATLGFLTVLMPCGVTQATMVVAVASGSPILGAAIMFAFVLGTSPVFFALGATIVELLQRRAFSYVAAGIVGVFAVLSINGGVALTGSLYTIQNFYRAATTPIEQLARGANAATITDGKQDVTIHVLPRGYQASATTIRAGVPVRLSLVTDNIQGCTKVFAIPNMNIRKTLSETGTEVVEFTPTKTGRLAYTCGMGMYTGTFEVL